MWISTTNFANPFVKQHLGRCYYQLTPLLASTEHRYIRIIDCLSFVVCLLLAPHLPRHFLLFLLQPLTVLMKQTKQAVCAIKQSILLRCLWHRGNACKIASNNIETHNRNAALHTMGQTKVTFWASPWISNENYIAQFLLCDQLLVVPFPRAFLQQPLTVLTRQTRQVVCAINRSIFLRCLWQGILKWKYHCTVDLLFD